MSDPKAQSGSVEALLPAAPILFAFAVREELEPFRRRIGNATGATLLLTGMGPGSAERAIRQALAEATPRCVLTCGFAGGLDPSLAAGTVIFEADPDFFLTARIQAAGATPARFHCADRVATTAAEKRALRLTTGADAVEMESGVIRAVCRERGIPSATVRVISDPAGESLPLDFNRQTGTDGRLQLRQLALAVAGSPGKIPALLRFARQTRAAAERLAGVLAAVNVRIAYEIN